MERGGISNFGRDISVISVCLSDPAARRESGREKGFYHASNNKMGK